MDYAPWEGKQMGAYGEGAGAAYVFSRSPAVEGYVWEQDQVRAATSMAPVRIKSTTDKSSWFFTKYRYCCCVCRPQQCAAA